jgi:hypothetical protein
MMKTPTKDVEKHDHAAPSPMRQKAMDMPGTPSRLSQTRPVSANLSNTPQRHSLGALKGALALDASRLSALSTQKLSATPETESFMQEALRGSEGGADIDAAMQTPSASHHPFIRSLFIDWPRDAVKLGETGKIDHGKLNEDAEYLISTQLPVYLPVSIRRTSDKEATIEALKLFFGENSEFIKTLTLQLQFFIDNKYILDPYFALRTLETLFATSLEYTEAEASHILVRMLTMFYHLIPLLKSNNVLNNDLTELNDLMVLLKQKTLPAEGVSTETQFSHFKALQTQLLATASATDILPEKNALIRSNFTPQLVNLLRGIATRRVRADAMNDGGADMIALNEHIIRGLIRLYDKKEIAILADLVNKDDLFEILDTLSMGLNDQFSGNVAVCGWAARTLLDPIMANAKALWDGVLESDELLNLLYPFADESEGKAEAKSRFQQALIREKETAFAVGHPLASPQSAINHLAQMLQALKLILESVETGQEDALSEIPDDRSDFSSDEISEKKTQTTHEALAELAGTMMLESHADQVLVSVVNAKVLSKEANIKQNVAASAKLSVDDLTSRQENDGMPIPYAHRPGMSDNVANTMRQDILDGASILPLTEQEKITACISRVGNSLSESDRCFKRAGTFLRLFATGAVSTMGRLMRNMLPSLRDANSSQQTVKNIDLNGQCLILCQRFEQSLKESANKTKSTISPKASDMPDNLQSYLEDILRTCIASKNKRNNLILLHQFFSYLAKDPECQSHIADVLTSLLHNNEWEQSAYYPALLQIQRKYKLVSKKPMSKDAFDRERQYFHGLMKAYDRRWTWSRKAKQRKTSTTKLINALDQGQTNANNDVQNNETKTPYGLQVLVNEEFLASISDDLDKNSKVSKWRRRGKDSGFREKLSSIKHKLAMLAEDNIDILRGELDFIQKLVSKIAAKYAHDPIDLVLHTATEAITTLAIQNVDEDTLIKNAKTILLNLNTLRQGDGSLNVDTDSLYSNYLHFLNYSPVFCRHITAHDFRIVDALLSTHNDDGEDSRISRGNFLQDRQYNVKMFLAAFPRRTSGASTDPMKQILNMLDSYIKNEKFLAKSNIRKRCEKLFNRIAGALVDNKAKITSVAPLSDESGTHGTSLEFKLSYQVATNPEPQELTFKINYKGIPELTLTYPEQSNASPDSRANGLRVSRQSGDSINCRLNFGELGTDTERETTVSLS